ncbi:MAG TPA: 3-dehydroquinate synthase family protein [Phycisphaerales bacterium]|nr:3-dehydroquinate synthase family protein [Phycisphaerales bacterium]
MRAGMGPAHAAGDARPGGAEPYTQIGLGDGATAHVGRGVLGRLGVLVRAAVPGARRALLVIDAGVPEAWAAGADGSLRAAGFEPLAWAFSPSERAKTLGTLEALLSEMARVRLERAEPVIALGGGITGDLAGFAAAVYRRGVPVVQCPSTLLAMVDAAVGGKTAVNLLGMPHAARGEAATGRGSARPLMKNMVGAFHAPRLVVADVGLLASLPVRELACGWAECIKHAVLGAAYGDGGLMEETERVLTVAQAAPGTGPAGKQGPECGVAALVARNVALKARVVAADPRERAADGATLSRAHLNLGHTFGHAIEAMAEDVRHGEAVGLGLRAAVGVAQELGLCTPGLVRRVTALLDRAGLPRDFPSGVGPESVMERLLDDKKVAGGAVALVLPTGDERSPGVTVRRDVPGAVIGRAVRGLAAGR